MNLPAALDRIEELEGLLGMKLEPAPAAAVWLTAMERRIVGMLLRGGVLGENYIFSAIHGANSERSSNTIRVHIHRLRTKLGVPIEILYGYGYYLTPESCAKIKQLLGLPVNAPVRTYDELVEAFRRRKEELGLSNQVCDELLNRGLGYTDHYLGKADKNIGPVPFILFCELFAIQFEPQVNPDAVKRMEAKWEQRDKRAVRAHTYSMSTRHLKRLRPLINAEKAQQMTEGRKHIPPEKRRQIARRAVRARWRKHRAAKRKSKSSEPNGRLKSVKQNLMLEVPINTGFV